jgi:hypothetical protein
MAPWPNDHTLGSELGADLIRIKYRLIAEFDVTEKQDSEVIHK